MIEHLLLVFAILTYFIAAWCAEGTPLIDENDKLYKFYSPGIWLFDSLRSK